ncbi:unnamed protein product [Prunus armeniaca]
MKDFSFCGNDDYDTSTSSAWTSQGERLPEGARGSSSAGPVARFGGGSHEPEQAQGQLLPGLKPEFCDVSAGITLTSAHNFALMGGTTNAKADTIHVNSGSPCLPLP